jgi:predicted small lipoprotein YifL
MQGRTLGVGAMLVLLAACGNKGPTAAPDTQSFTRNVNATPSKVVEATTAVFADRRIPVASTDQTNGLVESIPLALNGEWGNVEADQRVDCRSITAADPNARLVLRLRVKQDDNQSALSLDAKRDGGESCVLRSPFMTELLDEIVAKAGST